MLVRIKQKIIEKINKNGNSIFEPAKNKETINALKEIFNDTKNSRNKYKTLLLDGGFYNLGYLWDEDLGSQLGPQKKFTAAPWASKTRPRWVPSWASKMDVLGLQLGLHLGKVWGVHGFSKTEFFEGQHGSMLASNMDPR